MWTIMADRSGGTLSENGFLWIVRQSSHGQPAKRPEKGQGYLTIDEHWWLADIVRAN